MALTTAELQILITARDVNAGKELEQLEGKSKSTFGAIEKGSLLAVGGMALLGGAAIKAAADYEFAMSGLQAVSGATNAEMAKMSDLAKKIGADTAFSAQQAAVGMEELAANGLTTTQILNGAAEAAASLAAAGGITLPRAADIASTAIAVWGMETEDLTDVVNRLVGAADVSRFSVEDMGQAIAQGGGAAAVAGVSFQDFAVAIAATSENFSSGSDAATSYKTFVTSLTGNSKEAKAEIEALGLEFFDAQGNIKSTAEIAGELERAFRGMTDEQIIATGKLIFGNDAVRTMAGLMKDGEASVRAMYTAMGDTNALEKAEIRMGNTKGSLEELTGSLETLGITIGTHALPALTELADFATAGVNAFAGLPESTQAVTLGTLAFAAAAPSAVAGLKGMADMAKGLADGSATAGTKVAGLALGVGALAVAMDSVVNHFTGMGIIEAFDRAISGNSATIRAKEMEDFADALAIAAEGMEAMEAKAAAAALAQERLAEHIDAVASSVKEIPIEVDRASYEFVQMQNQAENAKDRIDGLARAWIASGATAEDVAQAYMKLPAALKENFRASEEADLKIRTYASSMASMKGISEDVPAKLSQISAGLMATVAGTEGSMTAFDYWTLSVGDAEEQAKSLTDVLKMMGDHMTSMNPTWNANTTQLTILKEELGDLEAAGVSYSSSLGLTKAEIETAIEALKGQNTALEENEDAFNALIGTVAMYSNSAAFNLNKALQDTVPLFEDQVEAAGLAATAFDNLAVNDIPSAITAFEKLQTKAPEAAKAVGPAFVAELQTSVANPAAYAPIIAWLESQGVMLGEAMLQGMTDGIGNAVGSTINAVIAAAGQITATAKGPDGFNTKSPSKVFMEIGRDIVEGLVLGIEERMPTAADAMREMSNLVRTVARTSLLADTEGLSWRELAQYTAVVPVGNDGVRWIQQPNGDWILTSDPNITGPSRGGQTGGSTGNPPIRNPGGPGASAPIFVGNDGAAWIRDAKGNWIFTSDPAITGTNPAGPYDGSPTVTPGQKPGVQFVGNDGAAWIRDAKGNWIFTSDPALTGGWPWAHHGQGGGPGRLSNDDVRYWALELGKMSKEQRDAWLAAPVNSVVARGLRLAGVTWDSSGWATPGAPTQVAPGVWQDWTGERTGGTVGYGNNMRWNAGAGVWQDDLGLAYDFGPNWGLSSAQLAQFMPEGQWSNELGGMFYPGAQHAQRYAGPAGSDGARWQQAMHLYRLYQGMTGFSDAEMVQHFEFDHDGRITRVRSMPGMDLGNWQSQYAWMSGLGFDLGDILNASAGKLGWGPNAEAQKARNSGIFGPGTFGTTASDYGPAWGDPGGSAPAVQHIHINAIDAQSLIDRADDIKAAVDYAGGRRVG